MEHFIILALAVWRLSSLVAREEGPGQIFDRFRHAVGVRYTEEGEVYFLNNFAKGVSCPLCNSIWFGAVASLSYYIIGWSAVLACIAWALALSALAAVVDEIVNNRAT